MRLAPKNIQELSEGLAQANADLDVLESVDVSALNQVRSYSPEDMTVTVEAGMSLVDLQSLLVRNGQWLPLDPPHTNQWKLGDLVNENPSGPRRCGNGVLRDYVIGLEAVRTDGQIIKSGGQVVKNVAGFDLCKLFIGAGGSLGVVTSMTFKLVPLPELGRVFELELDRFESLKDCLKEIRSLHQEVTPEVFDFCREPFEHDQQGLPFGKLIIGYAGKQEAVNQWSDALMQSGKSWHECFQWTREGNHQMIPELDHDKAFWSGRQWKDATLESMLPSRLPEWIETMPSEQASVARMGQGSLYHFDALKGVVPTRAGILEQRVKQTFDPNSILPALP